MVWEDITEKSQNRSNRIFGCLPEQGDKEISQSVCGSEETEHKRIAENKGELSCVE